MEIINRDANFNQNAFQRVNEDGKICDINSQQISQISEPFESLRKGGKPVSDEKELEIVSEEARKAANRRNLTRIRTKELEREGGFILVSGATIFGTLTIGTMIFMAIKLIVMK